jgi:alpha-L-rhamnosidase
LRVEYGPNPLGIDAAVPELSWRLVAQTRGMRQTSYQIRIASSERGLRAASALIFDSGKVLSDQSVRVRYGGPALQTRQRYYWQVRVWDERERPSAWSASAWWEMGLLSSTDWSARWIQPEAAADEAVMLRKPFHLRGKVASARAYVTSHGLYHLFLNGRRVGDAEFAPGWTSYRKRLQYQTYDVSDLLRPGDNVAGALLGTGWYVGEIGFAGKRNQYGKKVALLVQIEVRYVDGTTERIVTDGDWKSSRGPILSSSLYDGETYDARLEQPGWNASGFDDARWKPVVVVEAAKDVLVAQGSPPVRRVAELTPVSIKRVGNGQFIVDMGQNMVGWVRLTVQGAAGTTVTLRHTEVLDAEGRPYLANLRTADQLVSYTLKGQGLESFEPHFSFQGFRYVTVAGYPGALTSEKIRGVVLHSDLSDTGDFHSSEPLLDQLQRNIVWGLKGNFIDVPTDCPQRDERLGWTGDAQVFARTAAFNADVAAFFEKWLKDLAADQLKSGSVPLVVPNIIAGGGAAGWGDAATVIPWSMYLAYGDRRVLEQQYDSMIRWVEYQRRLAGEDLIWEGGFQFGDWLDFGSDQRNNHGGTDPDLIATAYFAHSADLLARAAGVLGKSADAQRYQQLFDDIRGSFQRRFVTLDGEVGAGTQTSYVLALQFGLLREQQREVAAGHLAAEVRQRGHLTTGFLGTPWLLFALSDYGYLDEAYGLLERREYPSWLYPITKGATTIWERWDGVKPDGSFQTPAMNSFNHYAYGAVGEWLYSVIAGINIDAQAPGYKRTLFRPRPGGGLTSASASHDSPYGRVSSSWSLSAERFRLVVEIPPNTTASVTLPDATLASVREMGEPLSAARGIAAVRQDGADAVIEIGSGRYEFDYVRSTRNRRKT